MYNNFQEIEQRPYYSPVEGHLQKLSYDELCKLSDNLDHTPEDRSGHHLGLHRHVQHVESGQYPHGLDEAEADILNKVSQVDHAARAIARQELEKEAILDMAIAGGAGAIEANRYKGKSPLLGGLSGAGGYMGGGLLGGVAGGVIHPALTLPGVLVGGIGGQRLAMNAYIGDAQRKTAQPRDFSEAIKKKLAQLQY